jgi:DNA-binding GntR family transcriptional regulator
MSSATAALEIVRTRSLASLVAQEVERLILAGEIAPGTRLNEQALAARLGVSRGPVREAIRGLERGGLVVAVVNQGSYVRRVSADEALDLFDLRVVLTGYACMRLAAAITAPQLAMLRSHVTAMDEAIRADDAAGYYARNLDFHADLLRFAGNARAQRIDDDLGNELHLFRRRALVQPENMRESNAEHAAIVRALAAGDAAAARVAGEAHITSGKQRFARSHAAVTGTIQPQQAASGGDHDQQHHDPPPEPARRGRGRPRHP